MISFAKSIIRQRGWRSRLIAGLVLVMSMSFLITSCGTDDIDISGYENEAITLSGITDQDVSLTIADLKAMDCITKGAESTSDKIGKVKATGPTLETVLSQYGMSQSDLKNIKVYARDDYDVKISSHVLGEDTVILAFGIDGQPLDGESAPLRIVIPGSDSAYWIRMVERIEVTK